MAEHENYTELRRRRRDKEKIFATRWRSSQEGVKEVLISVRGRTEEAIHKSPEGDKKDATKGGEKEEDANM